MSGVMCGIRFVHCSLRVDALIGEGTFGLVYLGQLTKFAKNNSPTSDESASVAVKMLKGNDDGFIKF